MPPSHPSCHRPRLRPWLCAAAIFAAPAMAQAEPRDLVGAITPAPDGDGLIVGIVTLNPDAAPARVARPERLEAELKVAGRTIPVVLDRIDPVAEQEVPARGFAEARYALRLPVGTPRRDAVLTLHPGPDAEGYAFRLPPRDAGERREALAQNDDPGVPAPRPPRPVPASPVEAPPSAKPDQGNAFLGNLSSYAPIYAAYGPGTNSDGRLQISFKYQLFGEPGAVGKGEPAINGVHFAYTQRMFWDLDAKSSPFHNIDFMPELFYLVPATPVGKGFALGGQAGYRHESNGRDGLDSRSINMLYVQPVATMYAGRYTISVGPRLWVYIASLEDNPDIKRYRGNTGLFAEIGEDEGFRLTTNSRFNFGSGKGAIDAELSYPLDRIFQSSLNIYLFGQAFAGYGENLLDYRKSMTRLRFGIAIVR